MTTKLSPYYFTVVDPDYSIKGSRDPLGFQVVWQQQAKKLIPYLSTVSSNVIDFQILGLAYFLYGKEPDNGFINYFIRFEQLMAYARFTKGHKNFSGLRKVAAILGERDQISISASKKDQILTNQRAYGIWAKYNRPYRDMGFLKHPDFNLIYSLKINGLSNQGGFEKLIRFIITKENFRIHKSELEVVHEVLNLTKKEQSFYEQVILKLNNPSSLQNELFSFLTSSQSDEFFSYHLLQTMKSHFPQNEVLLGVLTEIEETEKLICPLSRIFRYIQTKPLWARSNIDVDPYINQCKINNSYTFTPTSEHNKLKNHLSLTLAKDNWYIIEDLVKRNKEVTGWRGGAPWLTIQNDLLEVYHADGGFSDPEFNPAVNHDNDYFINTYKGLFQQILNR